MVDVEGVERLLLDLHNTADTGFQDAEINDPSSLVEQLRQAVLALDPHSPAQEADVALFSSFMLESSSPPDLLSFVVSTVDADVKLTKRVRVGAMRTVTQFIKHIDGTPHVDR
ncbi:unnamed protein product, partial [Discosporangium mesarthrocarpum]